jgi:hypothetical protein
MVVLTSWQASASTDDDPADNSPPPPSTPEDLRRADGLFRIAKQHLARGGVKLLTEIVENSRYHSYAKMDEALLTLGAELVREHHVEKGRGYLRWLIARYPASTLVPAARSALEASLGPSERL